MWRCRVWVVVVAVSKWSGGSGGLVEREGGRGSGWFVGKFISSEPAHHRVIGLEYTSSRFHCLEKVCRQKKSGS